MINQARRLSAAAPLDASLVSLLDHVEGACAGSVLEGASARSAFVFTSDVDRSRADPGIRRLGLAATAPDADRSSCVGRLTSDRGASREAGATIFVISFLIPDDDLGLFDEWYETDHSTILLNADGWLRVRRFEPVELDEGWAWNRLAVHDLRSIEVWDAPERLAARATPMRARVAAHPWFDASRRWMVAVDERCAA